MDEQDLIEEFMDATRITVSPEGVSGIAHAGRAGGAQIRQSGRFGQKLTNVYADALQKAGERMRQIALHNYDSYGFGTKYTSSGYQNSGIREAVQDAEIKVSASTTDLSVTVGIGHREEQRAARDDEANTPTIGAVAQWLFGGHNTPIIRAAAAPNLHIFFNRGWWVGRSVKASGPHPVFVMNGEQRKDVQDILAAAIAPRVKEEIKSALSDG